VRRQDCCDRQRDAHMLNGSSRLKSRLVPALAASVFLATGCTYLKNRGRDALDMADIGFTFSATPQFGMYANCPFIAPGGYSKVDGTYVGLGGGKFGVMEHRQEAAGLLFWGREKVDWGDSGSSQRSDDAEAYTVGPLGLAADSDGKATYKPQCAHYLHLGFMGVTGNLNYREWGDFLLGWVGLDINGDDSRGAQPSKKIATLAELSKRLCQPREGLQLMLLTDRPVYSTEDPIVLEVRLMNQTGGQSRRAKARDIPVYFEPFAKTPRGTPAEWLFKFFVFELESRKPCYRSPAFKVPAEQRGDYHHYATLPPNAFMGRRFVFPPARDGEWLEPGSYFLVVTYQVDDDYPYIIRSPELTADHVERLGTQAAYARVWTGKLCSNIVTFQVRGKRRLGIF